MADRKTRAQPIEKVRVPRPAITQALRRREQELRLIYDTVADVIFVLALEGAGKYRFTSVNATFCTVTGLNPDQVIGKRVDEVIPEPSLTFVLERYAEAIREKRIVRWEETSEYPTGRLIGEVSIAPAFDEAGNCTHLVGAVHNITERKRAEEALRESEAEKSAILQAIPDLVWRTRNDSTILDFFGASEINPFLKPEKLVGKKLSELMGRVVPEPLARGYMQGIERALETGERQAIEYQFYINDDLRDGEFDMGNAG